MDRILLLLAIYFAVGALAAACQPDGNHAATCANEKCEVIGQTEVCTQCKAGGVPIDGFCRPSTSPQAIAAGCATGTSGVCGSCSGSGFFLFLGGCYDARAAPGSGVCREARDRACVMYEEEVRAERAGAGEAQDPRTNCQADSSGGDGTCKVCGVHVSESEYCFQCNEDATYAPVNGQCADVTKAPDQTLCPQSAAGKCTQCGGNSLLYMGGCYQVGDGLPGKNLCALASDGVCTEAAPGYFLNPLRASDKDSVVSCSDTTGFTADSKTYNGVENCEACDGSGLTADASGTAKCTRCGNGKYLKDNTCVADASGCGDGYAAREDPDSGNKCVLCTDKTDGVTDCETCEYNTQSSKIKCTKCAGENYLKTVNDVTTCVTDCGEGYFKHTAATGGLRTCQSCSDTNDNLDPAAVGITGCAVCTYASNKVTCTKCDAGKYLKSDGTCADSCTANTEFAKEDPTNGNKCTACGTASDGGITDCSECSLLPSASRSSATLVTCTKCENSKYLKEGTCVDKAACTGTTFPKEDNSNGNKCLPCNDSTNGGIADCQTCSKTDTTVTCSACSGNKIVKTADGETSCIDESACNNGFFVETTTSGSTSSKVCTPCTDDNCDVCAASGANKCSKCKTDGTKIYLQKEADSQTGTCIEKASCTGTNYIDEAAKACNTCASAGTTDCKTCAKTDGVVACASCEDGQKFGLGKKSCVKDCPADSAPDTNSVCVCNNGFTPNPDSTACVAASSCKTPHCQTCNGEGQENEACTACVSNYYLTPTAQCVDSCEKLGSYYADGNVCKPCSPECASCSTAGANKCLSCPAGKVLKYTNDSDPSQGGSCVDECTPGTGAGGCETCGAVIGGSKYCSRCSTSSEYPVNGVCKASTARANECTTPDNKGGCTTCATGYFLLDGGCYETSRQPGSQVCKTTDSNGQCQTCANGQSPSSGVCPACPAGCSKCSGNSGSQTCSECLAGYYLSSSKCVKCSENSTNGGNTVTGVKDCVSCDPPSGNSGTVLCYVTQEPTVDPTDPSVNKGGLSSGAIAGISIAVIAVVGGLVGFLCWWFVCRGKA